MFSDDNGVGLIFHVNPVELRFNLKSNEWECDWGAFENMSADLEKPLHHLLLVTVEDVLDLLMHGPKVRALGGTARVSVGDGKRFFLHINSSDVRATWELFPALLPVGVDAFERTLLVGKWPD